MSQHNPDPSQEGRWRRDPVWPWLVAAEFVFLVAVVSIIISVFARTGFWPWLVMAAAIAIGWIVPVVVLVPRSAPRESRE